jgi:hypothetical protein
MTQSRIERMVDEVRITSYWKIAVLTIAAATVAVIIAIASMSTAETTAGETATPPVITVDSNYLPGQYVNKATGPSEHIQAF